MAVVLLALFHPDCDRRPRHRTGSADPSICGRRLRAPGSLRIPPVGSFAPPWERWEI